MSSHTHFRNYCFSCKYEEITTIDPLEDIALWIHQNISRPIAGFHHKVNGDGTYYTPEQQLNATRYQLLLIAIDYYSKGVPDEKILRIMRYFK